MPQVQAVDNYKSRIARQFSRAATHYDDLATVQGEIAADAKKLLPLQCHTLLDIGCGTGRVTRQLSQQSEHVIAMDLALGMLKHASSGSHDQSITWIQGDAEQLALLDASLDTVFSSMVLQWCKSPLQVMSEINRVLKMQGQAVLAVMCDGSFTELQQVWAQVDSKQHINHFATPEVWQQAAVNSGLQVKLTTQFYQTWHADLRSLLASIKGIGANVLMKPQVGQDLVTKVGFNRRTLASLEALYLQQSGENRHLPLSYHIAFLHCTKLKG
ncbi:methyltransferase domain-containing protein [Paraglaciecola hydrolytica]|uniref:Malonyl-[acyl-carrier protein] O-methyltransferase n=1 Tax=Paraglaciecola hydrolytica TaxID=1799789 RepID=A0A136A6K3_9ALTE|nr:methyltransferase domain-containing protein [Paraglaciecola hydrolytica]KXI30760.1 hypothetical protein AX660_04920 [Paraglaciecola hydrolytica]